VVLAILAVWGCVFLAWLVFSLAWEIPAILLAFTLPSLWDIIRDNRAWVEVWPNRIVWASALRGGDRSDIDHVRIDRRFDGGMKITLVHVGGAHTRLPPDVAPPIDVFQTALKDAGIVAQRHPFSPL
jgi:hypothetical protein